MNLDRKAEEFGGTDFRNWREYNINDKCPYFNKFDHLERSTFHQPNHANARAMRKIGVCNFSQNNLNIGAD